MGEWKLIGRATTLTIVLSGAFGCETEDDGTADAGAGGGQSAGGGAGEGGASTGGGQSGAGGEAPACEVTTLEPAPGIESCFACLQARCCDVLQACDQDVDCVYCIDNPLDTSERCIDMSNFSVKPNRRALVECESEMCVTDCGVDGGSTCTPANCDRACANFGSGCQ